jgi:hypothetical protein
LASKKKKKDKKMRKDEILRRYVINCSESRLQEVNTMLENDKNDFSVEHGRKQLFLILDGKRICGLLKKVDKENINFNYSKTLTNGNGENLILNYKKLRIAELHKTVLIFENQNISFENENFNNGYPKLGYSVTTAPIESLSQADKGTRIFPSIQVKEILIESREEQLEQTNCNFFVSVGNNIVEISDGDKKRLETYPIIIYLNGKNGKKDRFLMRFI